MRFEAIHSSRHHREWLLRSSWLSSRSGPMVAHHIRRRHSWRASVRSATVGARRFAVPCATTSERGSTMGLLLMLIGFTLAPGHAFDARELDFYHTHTGKALSVVYYHDGRYDPTALAQVEDYLKDFRTGDRHPIDPAL